MARSNITRICLNCNQRFFAWPVSKGRVNEGKFCNRACKTAYQHSKFWEKVLKTETCWIWIGNRFQNTNYGSVKRGGRPRRAHRVAYEMTYGEIPMGLYICHKCHNPPCVRPEHLYAGTHRDNTMDAIERGTLSHLTEVDILRMRARYAEGGITQKALAREYSVNPSTVSRNVRGLRWGHLK